MSPVLGVALTAVARRRVQTFVIAIVVLMTSATVVLGIGLLTQANAPFDDAFARQHGAHATVSFDPAKVSEDALRRTSSKPGVAAAAGPYQEATVALIAGTLNLGSARLVGRETVGGPVDQLAINDGRWLGGPGEIVLSSDFVGAPGTDIGDLLTVGGPGSPRLRIVGVAGSITDTADAWVWPTQSDVLHAPGTQSALQMHYRFSSAASETAVQNSVATTTAGLPADAVLGSGSYIPRKLAATRLIAGVAPFVVSLAGLGLVMSVLIMVNVASGAVLTGYRTIGVLKALGFTPRQVVAVYAVQVVTPAAVGCVVGVAVGTLLTMPVFANAARSFDVPSAPTLPWWVVVITLVGVPAVVAVAAIVPAMRGGRYSAVQAIAVGRAPRTGGGLRIRRLLARTPLPRTVSFGLGGLCARPARTAMTTIAVLLGATTVVFAVGMAITVSRAADNITRSPAVQVEVFMPVFGPTAPRAEQEAEQVRADTESVAAAIRAEPGTARFVGLREGRVGMVGMTEPLTVKAYRDDASWVGYPIMAGRWYRGSDEVVAASNLLRSSNRRVGDTIILAGHGGRREVRIVGEVLNLDNGGLELIMDEATLASVTETAPPETWEVAVRPGTDPEAYVNALSAKVTNKDVVFDLRAAQHDTLTFDILRGLIAILALLLSIVAALAVFSTVVLDTRERAHEIGILKAVGMTPRQVRVMFVASMAAIGVFGGLIALPLGYLLHHSVLPVMADAAGTRLPQNMYSVFQPIQFVLLGLAGVAITVLGALIPAGWIARAPVASALRSE